MAIRYSVRRKLDHGYSLDMKDAQESPIGDAHVGERLRTVDSGPPFGLQSAWTIGGKTGVAIGDNNNENKHNSVDSTICL